VCDVKEGSVLSSSVDGSCRLFGQQRGRGMMLTPFFECLFVYNPLSPSLFPPINLPFASTGGMGSGGMGGVGAGDSPPAPLWITAMAISRVGPCFCYIADSLGNIDILRRGDIASATGLSSSLHRFDRWEKHHALGSYCSISNLRII
jgi:hypothetical protein